MNRLWHNVMVLAPEGEVLDTKIDDKHGERNHALLKRSGNLWFTPDGSMYVYYTPTHWRKPRPDQIENLAREAEGQAKEHLARAAKLRAAR
jgi:hypothetical protein